MKNEETNMTTKLSYLLIGGGIGAILALLFAPKTGEELRSNIADVTRTGIAKTEAMAGKLNDNAQAVYADTKTRAGELYDATKQRLESVANVISEAPLNLQNALTDKVEQISSTIEAGQKEYQREGFVQNEKSKIKSM